MSKYQITTHSPKATMRLGERLALLLRPGNVVAIEGELGTGKTVLTKGIANGLGIWEPVTSPTFTIVKEYEGEIPFYHMDAYRLEYSEEDIGFDEYFHGDGITVIEWAQFVQNYLPSEILHISITYVDDHTRTIVFNPEGTDNEKTVRSLLR